MDVTAVAPAALPSVRSEASALPPSPADIEAHLPLVWRVARQVARRLPAAVDAEDLVGAGTLGLIGALGRYEVARCDRFGAYAEFRIRGAILDQLRELDWMPRSLRSRRRRLDEAQSRLHQRLGRAPDAGELAQALGTTAPAVERLRRDVAVADVIVGDAVDGAVTDETPGDHLEERELRARLARALSSLPARQQHVLGLYYVEHRRLREIGDELGVTESRVCQILRDAVTRLRAALLDD
jgi:RNA polymerase sigma factor for flagellar operon FliA